MTDKAYMKRCLELAQLGGGYTAPNPMVGAIIVCNHQIIGEGYHQRYGELHAEPNAICSVKDKTLLKHSTLYVNLEPCSHYGKTPPCAELIVSEQISRVVIGTLDPNPKVAGSGVEILRQAGIEVLVGVMEEECYELNKCFFTSQLKGRPYITLKWAQTQDGIIDFKRDSAEVKPLAVSNAFTRMLVHKLRSENQSIMVGTNTALLDNPTLTVRHWSGKNPVRVVIDEKGIIPEEYHLKDGSTPTLIYTAEKRKSEKENLDFVLMDFIEGNVLMRIIDDIHKRNISSVLIEGGSTLLQGFINLGLWDEAVVEVAPILGGKEGVKAPVMLCIPVDRKEFQEHQLYYYKNR